MLVTSKPGTPKPIPLEATPRHLANLQVVRYRKYSTDGFRGYFSDRFIHLVHDHAFQRHVSIFHDDVNLRDGTHGVSAQIGLRENAAILGPANLVVEH